MGRADPCLTLVSPGHCGPTCCPGRPGRGPPFSGPAPFQNPRRWNIPGLYDLCWWVMLDGALTPSLAAGAFMRWGLPRLVVLLAAAAARQRSGGSYATSSRRPGRPLPSQSAGAEAPQGSVGAWGGEGSAGAGLLWAGDRGSTAGLQAENAGPWGPHGSCEWGAAGWRAGFRARRAPSVSKTSWDPDSEASSWDAEKLAHVLS